MKIATRIIGAFLISVLCILVLAFYSRGNIERINESRKWVEHTVDVIIEKESAESALKDLESRTRGYVASGDERFLVGTQELKAKIQRGYDELKLLTADNPVQQQNLTELSPLLSGRIEQLDRLVEARKKGGIVEAQKFLRLPEQGATWQWMNRMDKIKAEEERLLKIRTDATVKNIEETGSVVIALALLSMLIVGFTGAYIVIGLSRSISALIGGTERVAAGELNFRINIVGKDEFSVLSRAFNAMIERLRKLSDAQTALDWHRSNLNKFSLVLQGQRKIDTAGPIFLRELVPLLNGHQAALYVIRGDQEEAQLSLAATYGDDNTDKLAKTINLGQGLIGQCAGDKKKMILHDVQPGNFVITSALTQSKPLEVIIQPILFEGEVKGVVEIASLNEFTTVHQEFLDELCNWTGAMLNSIAVSTTVDNLLDETQMLNEEMQAQQEELECQQDELRSANEELEEKAEVLDLQNQEISDKNVELEQMQSNLEAKASELTMASKYKSDFLANMSHDLRTPLNSLLIFSELLGENEEKNLQDFQVEYAQNIHLAGKTLLSLIDDVLDLSKIESGTVVLDMVEVAIADVISEMQRNFEKTAEAKGLQFEVTVASGVPLRIRTDSKRLSQLLTNLLTNAFKFTEEGKVKIAVDVVENQSKAGSNGSRDHVMFEVSDTGIGIEKEKQQLVFEPFRQADGTIKRKYGGTGLGLAICRQLSELLGGYVELKSEPSQGSTFTVILPLSYEGRRERLAAPRNYPPVPARTMRMPEKTLETNRDSKIFAQSEVDDDRRSIMPDDRILLVVEDDPAFARTVVDLARKQGFKVVVALCGNDGLDLARKLVPDGITLDLNLPDMQGWVVLDQLKLQPETRHIPIHIISVDKERQRSLEVGAVGFLEKPVSVGSLSDAINRIKNLLTREQGKILLVEHDESLRKQLSDLLSEKDVAVSSVSSGEEALDILVKEAFDCVVVDINLKDIKGTELVERIQRSDAGKPPMLVYADRELSSEEADSLNRLRRSSLLKAVDSPERLLSEVLLFLHRVEASLPESKRRILDTVRQLDLPLSGRKVLIVDDDPRNIAAMKGALIKQKMDLLYAENGKEALCQLEEHPDIELVLMDMMMPEMDGYEAMELIRAQEKFYGLPIIAVTAKAMKEDRRKCLEAGASDYIAKPVDKSQLLSLLRVWLYQR